MNTIDMLRNFPQAIIFALDENLFIDTIYGKQKSLIEENFDISKRTKLSMLFEKDVYAQLLSLLRGDIKNTSITFLNHSYDVYLHIQEDKTTFLLS